MISCLPGDAALWPSAYSLLLAQVLIRLSKRSMGMQTERAEKCYNLWLVLGNVYRTTIVLMHCGKRLLLNVVFVPSSCRFSLLLFFLGKIMSVAVNYTRKVLS